jgi:ubiquinone/menaquinone biosynthesis C-methylase UbiE
MLRTILPAVSRCQRISHTTSVIHRYISSQSHNESIIDQFTQQADSFAEKMKQHAEALALAAKTSKVVATDVVLDVACGPGLIACELAKTAKHVTGIDITDKMLERAAQTQKDLNLQNITWKKCDITQGVPFKESSFSLVVTRYSFHHLLNPGQALSDMVRVCNPGGRVVVIDAAPEPSKAQGFDKWETLRDPSHVRVLSVDNMKQIMINAGLEITDSIMYRYEIELEKQIKMSCPYPKNISKMRELMTNDVGIDNLGFGAVRKDDGNVYLGYPTIILVGVKNQPG